MRQVSVSCCGLKTLIDCNLLVVEHVQRLLQNPIAGAVFVLKLLN